MELHYDSVNTLQYHSIGIIYLCVSVSHSITYLSHSVTQNLPSDP